MLLIPKRNPQVKSRDRQRKEVPSQGSGKKLGQKDRNRNLKRSERRTRRVIGTQGALLHHPCCLSQFQPVHPLWHAEGAQSWVPSGWQRPGHHQGWEEKVASIAQSACVFATREGLLVGQSQLRAPDQALGERTNKCSLVRIPALGVTDGRRLGTRSRLLTNLPPPDLPGAP